MQQKTIPRRLRRIEDGFLSVVQLIQIMSGEVDKLTKRVVDVEKRPPADGSIKSQGTEVGHD